MEVWRGTDHKPCKWAINEESLASAATGLASWQTIYDGPAITLTTLFGQRTSGGNPFLYGVRMNDDYYPPLAGETLNNDFTSA